MFTGIVEETGSVASVPAGSLAINAGKVLEGMKEGGSIAVNGVCLTATNIGTSFVTVDVMPETLRRTNLGLLHAGDRVNLERPLGLGGELGGHLVQGHVDDTGRIASLRHEGGALMVRIEAPPDVMRYIVSKGFVAVDGISLTVATRDSSSFWVSVVDYTRRHTNLGECKVGDTVNLEIDILAKYVEQLGRARSGGVTYKLLREHGFIAN